jgi:hypothetical protein
MPSLARVSYWLIPAAPDKTPLAQMIQSLASRVNGPVFEPHVTLYSGPAESPGRIEEIVTEVAHGVSAPVLRSTALAHSAHFTKTLFVEFAPDDALARLAAKLKRLAACPEDYELKPHLSLVYANVDQAQRETLARSVKVPEVIRFDSLKAVLTETSTTSRTDVEAWRVAAARSLG